MICAINYDNDWNTSNNRDNINRYELIPICYYSIAEIYKLLHPIYILSCR
ncbi:MAG: hypothetical protein QXE62_05215 [Candidatus Nitrosocaldaceae archaeon]